MVNSGFTGYAALVVIYYIVLNSWKWTKCGCKKKKRVQNLVTNSCVLFTGKAASTQTKCTSGCLLKNPQLLHYKCTFLSSSAPYNIVWSAKRIIASSSKMQAVTGLACLHCSYSGGTLQLLLGFCGLLKAFWPSYRAIYRFSATLKKKYFFARRISALQLHKWLSRVSSANSSWFK